MPKQLISIVVTAPPEWIPSQTVIDGHECARGNSGFVVTVGAFAQRATATLGLDPAGVMSCKVRYVAIAEPGAIITIDVTIHDNSVGGPSLTDAVQTYVNHVQQRLTTYHGYKPPASINASITRGREMRSEWVVRAQG